MTTATRGPCSPWEPIWCCPISASTPMTTGDAAQIATEILYNLSGQIFDECTLTIRPCRHACNDGAFWGSGVFGGWGAWPGGGWSGIGLWPLPALIGGNWFNLTCGDCSGTCSCTPLCEAWLPGPVASIVSVKLDGAALPVTAYRVDDFRKLVRTDGDCWPVCQDLTLPDTADNTWSVTLTVGESVPMLGRLAAGELACQILSLCTGDACALPTNARTITRQGITIEQPTIQEFIREGFTGLKWVDTFIHTYNPQRLKAPPLVFDVDGERYRRTNT